MSNYTKENLIQIPPSAVPAGTLAIKVGNEIFTPGNIKIASVEFYKCASVDTDNKTWSGYKAVLENGFYTITDEQKTLEYGAFTPEVGNVYPEEMTGIFTPFKAPSLVPVINDQDTVLLIYPGASEGRIENIGNGRSKCTGDISYEGLTVEEGKIVRDGSGQLTIPSQFFPEGVLSTSGEWTMDIWYDVDAAKIDGNFYLMMSGNYSTMQLYRTLGGAIRNQSAIVWQGDPAVPLTPRRVTLECYNGTVSLYVNGQLKNTSTWSYNNLTNSLVFPQTQGRNDDWVFYGTYALISVRAKADHKGVSFDPGNSPYQ